MAPQSGRQRQATLDLTNGVGTSSASTNGRVNTTSDGKLKPVTKSRQSPSSKASKPRAGGKSSARAETVTSSPTASPSKPKGGIQSFFNKSTQRLQDQHRATTPQPPAVSADDLIETITSDEDSGGLVALSKGSSTALALRKRRFEASTGSARLIEETSSLPASQKFRKLDNGDRVASLSTSTKDGRPWTDRFGPTSVEELAVHKRKVDDVRGWLEGAFRARRNKALILKGPAGSGKTATIKLVAKSLGLSAVEWTAPTSREYGDAASSYASQFEEFMLRSGRSSGLVFAGENGITAQDDYSESKQPDGKHFLLVEDFPNTYSTASNAVQSFRSAIAQHLAATASDSSSPIPLVFVISETALSTSTAAADSFTTHRLLGPELGMHAYIDTIEFNPIAPTFLLKALDQIILKEARVSGRRFIPGKAVIKRLADFGDIRSAVSTLEFLLSRDGDTVWSGKVAFTKPKKKIEPPLTTEEEDTVKWISSRASSLDIFHAVGKVVYNKRTQPSSHNKTIDLPPWLAQHRRPQVPENDVNDLVTEIGTETDTFIAALHENYLLSCSSSNTEAALDSACGCLENLSDSDLLCLDRFSRRAQYTTSSATETLRQDEIAFQLGVRGVLFALPTNVKRVAPSSGDRRDAFRMFYPASSKLWRHQAETDSSMESVTLALQKLRPSEPVANSMRERLYTSAGVRPHAEVSGEANELRATSTSLLRMPKAGLMLECLPSVYSIIQVRDPHAAVLAPLRRVIRMAGFADNGAADDEAEESQQPADQWATDRPVEAVKSKTALPRPGDRLVKAQMPVEKEVASLVLEEDDIEDD